MALVVAAPTRLDFGGGWTDVPPFPEERGGFVCNLAIERRATVIVQSAEPPTTVRDVSPRTAEPLAPPDPLIAAARRYDAREAALHGWDPLELTVSLHSDFPIGAGLGGSSAAGVALAAAVAWHRGRSLDDRQAIAEWSRAVEVEELGIAGGRQDHYAAAFGGALGLDFGATVTVQPIPLADRTIAALEATVLVVYTGETRISGETITAVLDAYRERVPRVVDALDRMAVLARQMTTALGAGDLETLAALVDEHWIHQRALHAQITTPRIEALAQAVRAAGASGLKALGASGGGCVVIFAAPDRVAAVSEAAQHHGMLLSWSVARRGIIVDT